MSDASKVTSWEMVVRFLNVGVSLRNISRTEVEIIVRWPGWIDGKCRDESCRVPRSELRRALDELDRGAEELEELLDE